MVAQQRRVFACGSPKLNIPRRGKKKATRSQPKKKKKKDASVNAVTDGTVATDGSRGRWSVWLRRTAHAARHERGEGRGAAQAAIHASRHGGMNPCGGRCARRGATLASHGPLPLCFAARRVVCACCCLLPTPPACWPVFAKRWAYRASSSSWASHQQSYMFHRSSKPAASPWPREFTRQFRFMNPVFFLKKKNRLEPVYLYS